MMSPSEIDDLFEGTTFGMEYESGALDRHLPLPEGTVYCKREDYPITPSGLFCDRTLKLNMFGGELQLKPENSEAELLSSITSLLEYLIPEHLKDKVAGTNGLHMHVRIPKLLERPDLLKRMILWSRQWESQFLVNMTKKRELPNLNALSDELKAHLIYWARYVAKQKMTIYPEWVIENMRNLDSKATVSEIIHTLHNGAPLSKPPTCTTDKSKIVRPMFNYGHMAAKEETIEFRLFSSTENPIVLKNMIDFPLRYLRSMFAEESNPLRIIQGLDFISGIHDDVDPFTTVEQIQRRSATDPNMHLRQSELRDRPDEIQRYMIIQIISNNITMKDLNYPKFFTDKGFE